jgi:hypothetical protein
MQHAGRRTFQNFTRGLLVALAALAVCGMASAQDKQDKKEEFTFSLFPNPTTPLLPPSRRPRATLYFWRAKELAVRAMFACPKAPAFPGPSMALALKPHFLRVSLASRYKSSPTS